MSRKTPFSYRSQTKLSEPKTEQEVTPYAWMNMLAGRPMKLREQAAATRVSNGRLLLVAILIGLVGALFAGRLIQIQVVDAESYQGLASGNRVREQIEYAPRGRILDRNGVVLAENTVSYQLSATPFLLSEDSTERQADFELLASILSVPSAELATKVDERGDDFVQPVLLAENLDHQAAIRIEQMMPRLMGFSLDEVPTRLYKSEAALAHIVGYVGRVDELDLKNDTTERLLPIDFIGKTGIEKQYDETLRGLNGRELIEVDAFGQPVRQLARVEPQHGRDIVLSIDYDVQASLESAIAEQMVKAKVAKGSGVAVDPQTGEVLAMVSLPAYDNNLFARGITESEYNGLINAPNEPLFNKAIAGVYPSGSTIKPVIASGALQEQVITPDTVIVDVNAIAVTSQFQPGAAFTFRSWRPGGLGPMNVRRAIAWSSNIYFFTVGGGHGGIEGLGVERLTNYYRQFGLGELSGIDLPGENAGRVPDPAWKQEVKGEDWYVGDTYNISIGQGDLLLSPLQLAMAHAAVANNGFLLEPQFVTNGEPSVKREVAVSKDNLQIVREGMRQVLTGGTTCECTFSAVPVKVAGKSGTAETDPNVGRRPHAWYSAFAPYENPEILISVLLEEGVGGSKFAAPAIAAAMATYFNR